MKRFLIVPIAASLLLAGVAVAQTAATAADTTTPAADLAPTAGDGDKDHRHHFHGMFHGGFRHMPDPLADVPKPYTAESVKQALEAFFAKRPQVKSVTQTEPNVLLVEIVDRDGKSHKFELNETTGARRPAW